MNRTHKNKYTIEVLQRLRYIDCLRDIYILSACKAELNQVRIMKNDNKFIMKNTLTTKTLHISSCCYLEQLSALSKASLLKG